MLKYKGAAFEQEQAADDYCLYCEDNPVFSLIKDSKLELNVLRFSGDGVKLEGRFLSVIADDFYIVVRNDAYEYVSKMNHDCTVGCIIDPESYHVYSFSADPDIIQDSVYRIFIRCGDREYEPERIIYGTSMPFSNRYENMYFRQNSYLVSMRNKGIVFTRDSFWKRCAYEVRYIWDLLTYKDERSIMRSVARKAAVIRPVVFLNSLFAKKKIWLFRDEKDHAEDQTIALFEYVARNRNDVLPVFAISEKSPEYQRIRKAGRVIDCRSWKYKLLYLMSDCVITGFTGDNAADPFERHGEPYKDLLLNCRLVSLEQELRTDDISDWMDRNGIGV
jgi:hypothetical protein